MQIINQEIFGNLINFKDCCSNFACYEMKLADLLNEFKQRFTIFNE